MLITPVNFWKESAVALPCNEAVAFQFHDYFPDIKKSDEESKAALKSPSTHMIQDSQKQKSSNSILTKEPLIKPEIMAVLLSLDFENIRN